MTEEEARTKRCCGPNGCGEVRNDDGFGSPNNQRRYCIGSDCMAWREYDKEGETYGHCGLAGQHR